MPTVFRRLLVLLPLLLPVAPLRAYVDDAPSLGQVLKDSTHVVVFQVEKVSKEKRVVVFSRTADLKGKQPAGLVRHHIADGLHPREAKLVMDWAEPGKLAVCFHNGKTAQVCLGHYWYECTLTEPDWWRMTRGMPEQSLAYYGTVSRLRTAVAGMLEGKTVVITAVTHGSPGFRGYDAVAYKEPLRGKDFPVWRIRASLDMPRNIYHTSTDPKYVVGLGAGDADDVSGLLKLLADPNARTRAEAADELGLIGRPAKDALPALGKAMADADPLVRISAAEAIIRVVSPLPLGERGGGEGAVAAIALLIESVQHKQPAVRRAAADAMGNCGSDASAAVKALAASVKDADADVRWAAVVALGRIGPKAKSAVADLMESLKDETVAGIAADSLGGIGPDAKEAVPALARLIDQGPKAARWPAALALVRIGGPGAEAAVPVLVDGLKSDDSRARWDSLFYIQKLGPRGKGAVPGIVALFKDEDKFMRELAAWTVGTIGPDARDAIPALLPLLADEDEDVRLRASVALGHIGPAALGELVKSLKHSNDAVRYWSAYAIERMGPAGKEAAAALAEVLARDRDMEVRGAAASALGGIGPDAKAALPALTDALRDSGPRVRILAAEAIIRVSPLPSRERGGGEGAKAAMTLLGQELKHKDVQFRIEAAEALGRLGTEGKVGLPMLRQALAETDADVRIAAAEAIWRIEARPDDIVPVLIESLKEKQPDSRKHAAEVLGRIGPQAKAATSALARAIRDSSDGVRKAAADALRQIDRDAAARAGLP